MQLSRANALKRPKFSIGQDSRHPRLRECRLYPLGHKRDDGIGLRNSGRRPGIHEFIDSCKIKIWLTGSSARSISRALHDQASVFLCAVNKKSPPARPEFWRPAGNNHSLFFAVPAHWVADREFLAVVAQVVDFCWQCIYIRCSD